MMCWGKNKVAAKIIENGWPLAEINKIKTKTRAYMELKQNL